MTSPANHPPLLNGNNNSDNCEHWLGKALQLAQRAVAEQEVPVGAVVVYNNEIIGEGWNQPISKCDPSAHAEILALRQSAQRLGNYRLVDAELYVTLEPCAMCLGAMLQARIAKLIFGAFDPKAGAVCSVFRILDAPQLNHRIQWQGGVFAEESAALLKNFFQSRRAKNGQILNCK
jgi:tRNA(adenine34) deaminase